MTGIADLQATIDKLEAATDQAREVTRELHSAIKAARATEREMHGTVNRVKVELAAVVEEAIEVNVEAGLAAWSDAINTQIASSTKDMGRRMERAANVCIYGNEQGTGKPVFDAIREMLEEGQLALASMTETANRASVKLGLSMSGHGLPSLRTDEAKP